MLRIHIQKYPSPSPVLKNLIISVLSGVFIALFLIYFEPFNINLLRNENKVFQLLGFGCITTIVLLLFIYVFPLLLPNLFSDKNWKVRHQIILNLVILFIIATFNLIYSNYIQSVPFSWYNYCLMISRTSILGSLPIVGIIFLNYHLKNKSNIDLASNVLKNKKEHL